MAADTEPYSLHNQALVIDCHNDAIVSHILRGNLSFSGESPPDRDRHMGTVAHLRDQRIGTMTPVQINLPKMRRGGIDAAFFAVDVTSAWNNHLSFALDAFGYFDAEIEAHSDELVIAKSAEDIRLAKAEGKLAAILAIENSDGLERSLNVLRMLFRLGVRSIGLTHNPSSWAAAGNAEERSGGGLTSFGVQLVKEMNALGMLVDVSHIAERGFWDVLEVSTSPVLASHSNCKRLCDHPRNLSDEQIKGVANNNGVMAITFVPDFVDAHDASLPRLLEHIDHAVNVAGIDHVGLGSDFDGGGLLIEDATKYPQITQGLVARGYGEDAVRKILGDNVLRVLEQACQSQ